MKKNFLAILALATALCSCNKEETETVFTATTESATETKATYDDTYKCASWQLGEQISINGELYEAQAAGRNTTFKKAVTTPTGTADKPTITAPYQAYFPATLYDGTQATLPAIITETWAESAFNMPMYAYSQNTDLEFKNLCGILKIMVTNDHMNQVKSIRLSSADKALSGVFTVNPAFAAVLTDPDDAAQTFTVNYTQVVQTTAEGTAFYVAIPAQTYRQLMIELSLDGDHYVKAMTIQPGTDVVVARNTIYFVTFQANTPIIPEGGSTEMDEGDDNW